MLVILFSASPKRAFGSEFTLSNVSVCSVVSNTLLLHGLETARLLCLWNFLGKNTGAGCHFLLLGIFRTQRPNLHLLCLLHRRRILYNCTTWEAITMFNWIQQTFDLRRKRLYRWINTAPTVWLHCRNYFWPQSTTQFCKKKKGNFFAWVTVQRQFPGVSKTVGGEHPLLKSEKRNSMWLKTGDAVWSPFTEPALDHCKAALPPWFPPSCQGHISLSTVWERTLGIVVREDFDMMTSGLSVFL